MKHHISKAIAVAAGFTLPVLAMAQSYNYNYDDTYDDYYYNDYYNDYYYDSGTSMMAGGVALVLFLVFGLIGLVLTAFVIWMIVDAARRPMENKALWIILMVIFGFIPAVIYFFMVKRKLGPIKKTTPAAGGSTGSSTGGSQPPTQS